MGLKILAVMLTGDYLLDFEWNNKPTNRINTNENQFPRDYLITNFIPPIYIIETLWDAFGDMQKNVELEVNGEWLDCKRRAYPRE